MDNQRGIVPISKFHYIFMVAVNCIVNKAIIDTSRARLIIDLCMARKLNLLA